MQTAQQRVLSVVTMPFFGTRWSVLAARRSGLTLSRPTAHRNPSSAAAAAASFTTDAASAPVTGSAVLHRNIKVTPMQTVAAKGTRMRFSNGHEIEDTTCGAAVACLGHGNERVKQAMIEQLDKFSYCNSVFFGHQVGEDLATELINGTNGVMSKAYIMSSGKPRQALIQKLAKEYIRL